MTTTTKKNPMGAKAGLISASQLIEAKDRSISLTTPDPSEIAIAELAKVCTHNDATQHMPRRISSTKAIEMLRSHGWVGNSIRTLNSLCQRRLGRSSYGTP